MTDAIQTKPTPQSVLLVFGKPTSADLPQASWFHIEDRARVIASAQSLKFSVLDVQTSEDNSLLDGVHEGVLKGTGRMIVGSVTPEVYKRIDEHAAKMTGALTLQAPKVAAAGLKGTSEQTTNDEDKVKPLSMASDPWDGLRVGSHVVAKHWYSGGEANGWWIAVITAINGKDYMIQWPDEPNTPPLKAERKHLAILNPAFDVNREWENKR
jgi:hypothetical protein